MTDAISSFVSFSIAPSTCNFLQLIWNLQLKTANSSLSALFAMSSNRSRYCCRLLVGFILIVLTVKLTSAVLFFPRGGSIGVSKAKSLTKTDLITCAFQLLAAVAIPLDLTYRNVYMAFNFESNYGLPSNDSYNQWIDRVS